MRSGLMLGAAALAMAAMSTAAQAATPGSESLQGFYLGVHAGYGVGSKDWAGPPNPIPTPPLTSANLADHSASGLLAGGTAGARFETGGFVFGIEGELSWADLEDDSPSTAFAGFTNQTEVKWMASLTAQVGINAGGFYPYLEAGAGFVRDRYTITDANGVAPDESDSISDTRTGVVLGVGAAFGLGGGWSARGEYNYGNYGRRTYSIAGDSWTIDQTTHSFRLAFLYRFGG